MTTILPANVLIEIPEEFRMADALKPGQRCEIELVGQGEYRLRVENGSAPDDNWVDWLLACPEKGWFVEADRSEMTSLQTPAHFAVNG
jgi:hypothetical protein